jgi:S1-C subfamily serine protease
MIRALTREEAEQIDLPGGLVVTGVERGTAAARSGIEPGWIVVQIGNQFPRDLDHVGLLLENVRAGDQVTFRVWRIDRRYISVYTATLPAR